MSTAKFDTLSNLAGTQTVPVETVAQGSAKAWVNFNGTGTVAIRASFNVSSITDNGTGDYTINFTNALVDANYAIAPYGVQSTSNSNNFAYGLLSTGTTSVTNITASSFRFKTGWLGSHVGQVEDMIYVGLSFFR